MSARLSLGIAIGACILAGACVDLFHGTDFETLCTHDPGNAACGAVDSGTVETSDAQSGDVDLCSLAGDPAARASRACAWLGACEGAKDASRFGPCYVEARVAYDCNVNPSLRPRGAVARLWACLDKATTCDAVDQCVFGGPVPKCKDVTTGSFTSCTGDGAVRVQCAAPGGGRPAAVEPCLLEGRACTLLDSSRSACTAAKTNACTAGTSACTGTSASHCTRSGADDLDLGLDCAGYGEGTCSGTTSPSCTPGADAPSCAAADGQVTCKGSNAHVCVGGRDVAIGCGSLGLDCDATNAFAAVPWSACTKTPAGDAGPTCTDEDSCSGTTLKSCAAGTFQTVDCAQAGLGACSVSASGAASCARP